MSKQQKIKARKIFAFLSLALIAATVFLVVYVTVDWASVSSDYTYEYYSKKWGISYDEILFQDDTTYYVLIWQEDCEDSTKLERYVCEYIDSNSLYSLYLCNAEKYASDFYSSDGGNYYVDQDSYDELKVVYTPTMLIISDGEVAGYQIGYSLIRGQLSKG